MFKIKTLAITLILTIFSTAVSAGNFSFSFPKNSEYYLKAVGTSNVNKGSGETKVKISLKDKKKKLFYIEYKCNYNVTGKGNYDVKIDMLTRKITPSHPSVFGCFEDDTAKKGANAILAYIESGFTADLIFRVKVTADQAKKGEFHLVGVFGFKEGPLKFNYKEGFKLAGWGG